MLSISAIGMESRTPFTPSNVGKVNRGIIRKISVRNKEIVADIFPLFSAVKKPEANRLNPISRNAAAKIKVPRTAIKMTDCEPSAKSNALGFASGKEIANVTADITAIVFSAARKSV